MGPRARAAAIVGGGIAAGAGLWYVWRSGMSSRLGGKAPLLAPAEVRAIIAAEFRGSSIPLWFALTNAALESGFRPSAMLNTAREDSYGLYMINWRAHEEQLREQGIEDPSMLLDAATNAAYWHLLVKRLKVASSRKGFSGDRIWEAIRLRLAGIVWDKFETPLAQRIKSRFWRYAGGYR